MKGKQAGMGFPGRTVTADQAEENLPFLFVICTYLLLIDRVKPA